MRIMKTVFSFIMVLCLLSGMCLPALADTWDLTQGSIEIGFQDDVQHVTQNSTSTPDANPIITSDGNATGNTISVSSGEGQTAQMTIENVVIQTDGNTSGIDIADGSTVQMTVSGTNSVDTIIQEGSSAGGAATVHVGSADLTIQGDGNGSNVLSVNDNGTYHASQGAGIGSNDGEDFSGTIHITGDVDVTGEGAYYGAGIGSGRGGDFTGELNITNGAVVTGDSAQNGAAIGGGYRGEFSGSIYIADSTVTGTSYNNGAGIGSGSTGDFSGTLTIEDSDVRARAGFTSDGGVGGNAAGIGAGYAGDFTGTVTIQDSTVDAAALGRGAGIGSGGDGNEGFSTEFSGAVTIDNSEVTADSYGIGTAIGAPTNNGVFSGSIEVTGNSVLNLMDRENTEVGDEALLGTNGTNTGTITMEDSAQVNAWRGTYDSSKVVSDDRDSYREAAKSGSYSAISMDDLNSIAGDGAQIIVVHVSKVAEGAEAEAKAEAEALVDSFWAEVEKRIRTSQKGDEITVDAQNRTSMPVRILELAAEYGVTMIIRWNGGEDIAIKPDHGIESDNVMIPFATLQKRV